MKIKPVAFRLGLAACLVFVSAAVAAAPADDNRVDLRPRFVAGRVARYELWTRRDQTVNDSGANRAISLSYVITGQITWAVQNVQPDGSATCVLTYDYLTMTVTLPNGTKQVCDSRQARGDNENYQRFITAIAGSPVRVDMAVDGQVKSVDGVEQIRQRVAPGSRSPDDMVLVKTASSLATVPLAPETLGIGGTWDTTFRWVHDVGHILFPTRFTLASVQDMAGIPVATIYVTAKPRIEPELPQLPPNAPKIDFRQSDGRFEGQILMDLDRHEVAGRNEIVTTRLETQFHGPNNQTRVIDMQETIQSQVLRISEQ